MYLRIKDNIYALHEYKSSNCPNFKQAVKNLNIENVKVRKGQSVFFSLFFFFAKATMSTLCFNYDHHPYFVILL